jgi:sec-independent protein translocase protein TatB
MFNIGWGEMLVLVVIGLIVLGPERLPGAIRWTADALRQAREYLSGATSNLREELGPEFDDLRAPLSELQKLRGMTPRQALTKHLLDGDDSVFHAFDRPVDLPPDPPATTPLPEQAQQQPQQPPSGTTPFDSDAT